MPAKAGAAANALAAIVLLLAAAACRPEAVDKGGAAARGAAGLEVPAAPEARGEVGAEPQPSPAGPAAELRLGGADASIPAPDPERWPTEVFAAVAEERLRELLTAGAEFGGGTAAPADLPAWVAPRVFRGSFLAPGDTELQSGSRPVSGGAVAVFRRWFHRDPGFGREAFDRDLDSLLGRFSPAPRVGVSVDRVGAGRNPGSVSTRVRIELDGTARSGGGRVQVRSLWRCGWSSADPVAAMLDSVYGMQYSEVQSAAAEPWFADRTAAVFAGEPSWRQQLSTGLDGWLGRLTREYGITIWSRNGIALGDIDGDGLDDLVVGQPSGLPNRLYRHRPDGTVRDVSAAAGVDFLDHTTSALFVDLDNDGDQDLLLGASDEVLALENDGAGRFVLNVSLRCADRDIHALAAADYDGDGDLDFYVTFDHAAPGARPGEERPEFVYHAAENGGANVLFRNDLAPRRPGAAWSFTDVTAAAGLDVRNRRHSLAAAWEDYDRDGDPDLYVANDYGENVLYRNEGAPAAAGGGGEVRFTEVAAEAGVTDRASGMSAAWADFNRDGWPDLYVANMFSNAGGRVVPQAAFRPGADPGERAFLPRFAKGNSLFWNRGGGTFSDVGRTLGAEMGRWAWASPAADIDNDGWEDIFVANGFITGAASTGGGHGGGGAGGPEDDL